VYSHGLARFASEVYDTLPTTTSGSKKKKTYRFSHLTNYSINKKNQKEKNVEEEVKEDPFDMSQNKW
jgi:hypothetical protein